MWISLVEAVSDLTKLNFSQVFEMTAMEFFMFVQYCKYKQAMEEKKIKAFRAKTK